MAQKGQQVMLEDVEVRILNNLDAVTSSGILKAKQKLGVRSKFIQVVIDPLFFRQKNYKGLLLYQ